MDLIEDELFGPVSPPEASSSQNVLKPVQPNLPLASQATIKTVVTENGLPIASMSMAVQSELNGRQPLSLLERLNAQLFQVMAYSMSNNDQISDARGLLKMTINNIPTTVSVDLGNIAAAYQLHRENKFQFDKKLLNNFKEKSNLIYYTINRDRDNRFRTLNPKIMPSLIMNFEYAMLQTLVKLDPKSDVKDQLLATNPVERLFYELNGQEDLNIHSKTDLALELHQKCGSFITTLKEENPSIYQKCIDHFKAKMAEARVAAKTTLKQAILTHKDLMAKDRQKKQRIHTLGKYNQGPMQAFLLLTLLEPLLENLGNTYREGDLNEVYDPVLMRQAFKQLLALDFYSLGSLEEIGTTCFMFTYFYDRHHKAVRGEGDPLFSENKRIRILKMARYYYNLTRFKGQATSFQKATMHLQAMEEIKSMHSGYLTKPETSAMIQQTRDTVQIENGKPQMTHEQHTVVLSDPTTASAASYVVNMLETPQQEQKKTKALQPSAAQNVVNMLGPPQAKRQRITVVQPVRALELPDASQPVRALELPDNTEPVTSAVTDPFSDLPPLTLDGDDTLGTDPVPDLSLLNQAGEDPFGFLDSI